MKTAINLIQRNNQQKLALITALFAVLAGCGGGGGGGGGGGAPSAAPVAASDGIPAAGTPITSDPLAGSPPAGSPPAGSPPAGSPPAGSVATLADFEACPQTFSNYPGPYNSTPPTLYNTDWQANCLVGKRLVGTGPTQVGVSGSPVVPCELYLKPDGAFQYTKNGVLFASTPPSSAWSNRNSEYTNFIQDANLPNGLGRFTGKLGGNPTDPASIITDQIRIGIDLVRSASVPVLFRYELAFTVTGLSGIQACYLSFS